MGGGWAVWLIRSAITGRSAIRSLREARSESNPGPGEPVRFRNLESGHALPGDARSELERRFCGEAAGHRDGNTGLNEAGASRRWRPFIRWQLPGANRRRRSGRLPGR